MELADRQFFNKFLELPSEDPCQVGHCQSRPDCSNDYYLVGITTQTLRANRVARLWGKPLGGCWWNYYLSDDHHPKRKIQIGDRAKLKDGEIIKVSGYLVPHKVQLYENPTIMPCCL